MTDLANLGIRVETQNVDSAEDSLNNLAAAARNAENSTESLSGAARGLSAAEREAARAAQDNEKAVFRLIHSTDPLRAGIMSLNNELRESERLYQAGLIDMATYARAQTTLTGRINAMRQAQMGHRREMGLTRHEALNLGRQFSDVGVSLASGMPFYLIAIQQGAQIGEIFAEARTRGVGFRDAINGVVRSLAPLAVGLATAAAIGGAVVGAFALVAREANKAGVESVESLGLTEEQMERLRESGENTAITLGDAWRSFGTTIKEVLQEAFGEELAAAEEAWNSFLDSVATVTGNVMTFVLERFLGAYFGIKAAWSGLPGAIGDVAVSAANAVVNAVEWMLNKAIQGINAILPVLNLIRRGIPGFGAMPDIGEIGAVELGGDAPNSFAGQAQQWDEDIAAGRQYGIELANSMAESFVDRWMGNMADSREARLRAAAGDADDPRRGRQGGQSDSDRELQRRIRASERFLENLRQETREIGLNAIQVRMMAIETAAAEAPTAALAAAIRAAGEEWRTATIAFERQQVIDAVNENTAALLEEAEMLALERDLIGASNTERERQLAMLAAEIELRRQAREHFLRTGEQVDFVNTPEGQRFIAQAGQNAVDAAAMADLTELHNALQSTFESAMTAAMRGDWRGVLQTILTAIFDNVMASFSRQFADLVTSQSGSDNWLGQVLGMFGFGGTPGNPTPVGGPPVMKAPEVPLGAPPAQKPLGTPIGTSPDGIAGKIVVEFREGDGFGGKVVEYAGPLAIEAGKQAVKGGAQQARVDIGRQSRRRLGVNV